MSTAEDGALMPAWRGVIAKQTRGNRMRGLMTYLFGPGRHEEHRDPRLVAAWEPVAGDGRLTTQELDDLVDDLDAPRRFHGAEVTGGYVWQCSARKEKNGCMTVGRLGYSRGPALSPPDPPSPDL